MRALIAFAACAVLAAPVSARAGLPTWARRGPYRLEVLDASGQPLRAFPHAGRVWVLGTRGARYAVRVVNDSAQRVEAVVSVDGRDVRDGRPAAWTKRGYVVPAYGQVTIDGFRLSEAEVAAFRFSSVEGSYAAKMGDARDVGVIGVAVFEERAPEPVRLPAAEDAEPHARAAPPAPAPEAQASGAARKSEARPGLGTAFGERRESPVVHVGFERARESPDAIVTVRYDDRDGLAAVGIDVDGRRAREEALRRERAEPFRGSGYAEPPPGWRG